MNCMDSFFILLLLFFKNYKSCKATLVDSQNKNTLLEIRIKGPF